MAFEDKFAIFCFHNENFLQNSGMPSRHRRRRRGEPNSGSERFHPLAGANPRQQSSDGRSAYGDAVPHNRLHHLPIQISGLHLWNSHMALT